MKSITKVFNKEYLKNLFKFKNLFFVLGIIFLPFDNLFFAPSSGWATITPILFMVYLLINFKTLIKVIVKYWKILAFILVTAIISIIGYATKNFNLKATFNTFISIGFGLVVLFSLDIYFIEDKNDIKPIVGVMLITYSLSFCIGLFQLFAIKLNLDWLKRVFIFLEKRSYISNGRVQFTFTEPSFAGMHLYGVLLPTFLISKDKKVFILMTIYAVLAVILGDSVRIILDTAVVFGLLALYYFIKNWRNTKVLVSFAVGLVLVIGSVTFVCFKSSRVQKILDKGVYADGSLATRYFQINASLKGYKKSPLYLISGYGYGNAVLAIRDGYDEARLEYESDYVREIDAYIDENFYDDAVCACMYVRLISEIGLLATCAILFLIIALSVKSKNVLLLLITMYLYIQFSSFAFYTLWILILKCLYDLKKLKIEKNAKEAEVGSNISSIANI